VIPATIRHGISDHYLTMMSYDVIYAYITTARRPRLPTQHATTGEAAAAAAR